MQLPVNPPVKPMLSKPVKSIPPTGHLYEPKWDGFRCIVFRDGDEVELGSRNERPMTRYFPEVVAGVRAQLPPRCVVDGELVVPIDGRLDFDRLQDRIHPAASRVRMLAEKTPASFMAFDLLALGEASLLDQPFHRRREQLVQALADAAPPVYLTPATDDAAMAQRWFDEFEGAGLDGVIAKPLDGTYQPDVRALAKIKHQRTCDAVLAGLRWHKHSTAERPLLGSMLLGLYTGTGELAFVGVSASFPTARRAELAEELSALRCSIADHPWSGWGQAAVAPDLGAPVDPDAAEPARKPGAVSRWNAKKDLSFVPLRPERVVEVAYDAMQGTRFRHTARFLRWRTDRDPRSCTFEQVERPVASDLASVLGG
jgi:ATP-dependent DNA ligase